jgi:hypothetical protein
MPTIIETIAYEYTELSDKAKARARQDYVEQPDYPYDEWWQFDDFVECGRLLGIEIEQEQKTTKKGHKYTTTTIYFELYRQGGASFAGRYKAPGGSAAAAIAAYAPHDETLLNIGQALDLAQVRSCIDPEEGEGALEAIIALSTSGSCHSGTMRIQVTDADGNEVGGIVEEAITVPLKRFADWMHEQLQEQYDYHFSDEYLDEQLGDYDNGKKYNADGSII